MRGQEFSRLASIGAGAAREGATEQQATKYPASGEGEILVEPQKQRG